MTDPENGTAQDHPNARYHLAIFDDHLRSLALGPGTVLVGRSRSNHLRLNDTLLSRKHCSLSLSGAAELAGDSSSSAHRLTLVDLNSSNGTFVNGDKIGTRQLVKDDIIELGKTVMVVFDGESWGRGEGLMNLRNPVKAQELIQRLREGTVERTTSRPEQDGQLGIRAQKGLTPQERAFLKWLEQGENRVMADLVTDYLNHKLVSLLVRNSKTVRSAFTAVLEGMMRPEFFSRFGEIGDLRQAIAEMVRTELDDLRQHDADSPLGARDLLQEADGDDEEPDLVDDNGRVDEGSEPTPAREED